MTDIALIAAVCIAASSVVGIPIMMIRHLREDVQQKLASGNAKFEKTEDKFDDIHECLVAIKTNIARMETKVDLLYNQKKRE